ncbi:hypothetical protein ASD81_22055 [Nocardioides sp. Root614]|nr:hypothetical protein ASD81_22055 [Nocardioides sp. Root614]KRA88488.1 hypothetical protein ASD84_19560 [Nocardioides sp. Root682]
MRKWAVPFAALLVLAGCGYDDTTVPKPEAVVTTPAVPTTPVKCDNKLQSYAPSDNRGAAIANLANKGRLVVGVSGDTLRLGSRNPETGKIEGFDIAFAQRVADELGVPMVVRVISAADRIGLLEKGEIDMVARNMTVNCDRWSKVAFSAVYYNATQKVLVRADAEKDYKGPQSLSGKRVCAPTSSTSVDNIKAIQPDVVAVLALKHTGCLVKFQNGDVDAITGDDTVLAGLAAQDPYAVVPKQGKLTDEPYGIAVNKGDVALARFINSVLDEMRSDGSWKDTYDEWLKPYLLVDATPPTPVYGR